MSVACVTNRCVTEVLTGPKSQVLGNHEFPLPRFMGHGVKRFRWWLDYAYKDRAASVCVCVCVCEQV
jgi:hypothetical protein